MYYSDEHKLIIGVIKVTSHYMRVLTAIKLESTYKTQNGTGTGEKFHGQETTIESLINNLITGKVGLRDFLKKTQEFEQFLTYEMLLEGGDKDDD